jgi:hypothetical protein
MRSYSTILRNYQKTNKIKKKKKKKKVKYLFGTRGLKFLFFTSTYLSCEVYKP